MTPLLPEARRLVMWAAILGATGVLLGAFGAHALAGSVTPARLAVWQTAVHYQLVHALALLALAALAGHLRIALAMWCWVAGTVVFSGSLILLVLTDTAWLGAITPLGGVLLILGWVRLMVAAWRER